MNTIILRQVFVEGWYIVVLRGEQEVARYGPYKAKPGKVKLMRVQEQDLKSEKAALVVEE